MNCVPRQSAGISRQASASDIPAKEPLAIVHFTSESQASPMGSVRLDFWGKSGASEREPQRRGLKVGSMRNGSGFMNVYTLQGGEVPWLARLLFYVEVLRPQTAGLRMTTKSQQPRVKLRRRERRIFRCGAGLLRYVRSKWRKKDANTPARRKLRRERAQRAPSRAEESRARSYPLQPRVVRCLHAQKRSGMRRTRRPVRRR